MMMSPNILSPRLCRTCGPPLRRAVSFLGSCLQRLSANHFAPSRIPHRSRSAVKRVVTIRTGSDVRADFAHGCVLGGRCLGPSATEKPLHEAPWRLHGLFRGLIGNHAHGPSLLLDHAQQPIPVVLIVLRQPIPVGFEVGNPPLFLGYKGFQPLKSFLKNMGITVCSRRSFSRFAFVRCLGSRTSLRTGL